MQQHSQLGVATYHTFSWSSQPPPCCLVVAITVSTWQLATSLSIQLGLFQKKSKRGIEDMVFWKHPLDFLNFSAFYGTSYPCLRNSKKQAFTSGNSAKLCVTPLRNSKVRNQDPRKLHMNFPKTPLEIPLLFQLTPGICTCAFFNSPYKCHAMP